MNSNDDFCEFPVQKMQEIQALSRRMQALNSLLNFFDSDAICDRQLASDCKVMTDWLELDFKYTLEALVEIIDLED